MLQARKAAPIHWRRREIYQPSPAPGRQPRRRWRKAPLLLVGLSCLLLGLVVIIQYSRIVSLHYEVSRAEVRLQELDEEYRRLEQEAARLSSLSRIEAVARGELGMREPTGSQVKVLEDYRGN